MCSSSFFSSSPRNRHFIPFFFLTTKVRIRKLHSFSPQIFMVVMSLVTVLGTENINKGMHDYLNIIPVLKKFTVREQVNKCICFCKARMMIFLPCPPPPTPNWNSTFSVKPSLSLTQGRVSLLHDFTVLYDFTSRHLFPFIIIPSFVSSLLKPDAPWEQESYWISFTVVTNA